MSEQRSCWVCGAAFGDREHKLVSSAGPRHKDRDICIDILVEKLANAEASIKQLRGFIMDYAHTDSHHMDGTCGWSVRGHLEGRWRSIFEAIEHARLLKQPTKGGPDAR